MGDDGQPPICRPSTVATSVPSIFCSVLVNRAECASPVRTAQAEEMKPTNCGSCATSLLLNLLLWLAAIGGCPLG